MKNYLKLSLTLAVTLVFYTSCDKEETKPSETNKIFPVNMNNRWVYEGKYFHSETDIETYTFINEIKYEHTIAGIKGFALEDYKTGEPISLVNNDKDGNCIESFFDNNKLIFSEMIYKNKVNKNDTWKCKAAYFTGEDYNTYEIEELEKTCIAVDTIISTPIKNFNCVAHSYHPGGLDNKGNPYHTMIDFMAENIGVVKQLHYEHDKEKYWLFREITLIDYSISE